MSRALSRRAVVRGAVSIAVMSRPRRVAAQEGLPAFSLPIGWPGQILGDGFFIRHGYATENTWYNPGWLHTAEDFYVLGGNAAGAGVFAIADGEIVFAGSEYPGLVVIVRHAVDLFSMYGHLDYALAVERGSVRRGQLLGTVLDRTDGRAPSHLHFEVRTFLTATEVNGEAPRYSVGCGFNCAPGPGYWPIDAPEHPSAMGWRNPTHVLANRAYVGKPAADAEIVVASLAADSTELWSLPSDRAAAERTGELALGPGDRYALLDIAAGPEAPEQTSAEGYRLWHRIAVPGAEPAWVRAAAPSSNDTGSDGRPSSIRLDFLPALRAD